jgi:TRAP-type mannitol/chloroaromatic compound transport system permease small subunit
MNSHSENLLPTGKHTRRWATFGGLTALLNSIGTGWIFVLLMLVNTDIIGRTLFNRPVRGVAEIVGMTIVACVFLQLAHAIRNDRLTRSEIILVKLRKYPRFKRGLEGFYDLMGGLILTILFVYSVPMFVNAWTTDDFVGAEGDFMAPVWPVKLIIVIGSLLGAIQCLLNFFKAMKEMRSNPKERSRD